MGAGLLAKAVGQSASMLTVRPSSRASSLPQFVPGCSQNRCPPQNPCGSELARDGGGSAHIHLEYVVVNAAGSWTGSVPPSRARPCCGQSGWGSC
ncbi:hypothetical protein F7R20_15380 [Pseudomonas brassicacearum subsp. brassicacearum]|nr:hypothetical protein F7R20_15380 [Pseudomonas brassicacearum subsp. brassicacearum]QEO76678.1 hypothetical protein ELZ14_03585 [Pseudomonas brassicacearum]